jgi:hypothetical protein
MDDAANLTRNNCSFLCEAPLALRMFTVEANASYQRDHLQLELQRPG